MCHYQFMVTLHFLNDVANDAEFIHRSKKYVIIASLKRETTGKLINRISGSRASFDIKFEVYQARL